MKLLVQKYGGTSVANSQSRLHVIEKIKAARAEGWSVAAVISAMGRRGEPYATDTLLHVYADGQRLPNDREQDAIYACGEVISGCVLARELQSHGVRCVFLNGGQAGIITDDTYSEAAIKTIHPEAIRRWLEQDYVVLIAGGQGVTETGDVTSIGRGGSDTTACAVGYYLEAEEVRIYTDVDGIYTGDPRVIENARPIKCISYDQCRRLAERGAKVIHPKAVAFSQLGGRNVLSVRSTFTDSTGTAIGDYDSDCAGITASRGQLLVRTAESERSRLLEQLRGLGPTLLESRGEAVYCCVDAEHGDKLAGFEPVKCDVIFTIGPNACQSFEQMEVERSMLEDWLTIAPDTVVVFGKPGCYEPLINRLHDSLCIRG